MPTKEKIRVFASGPGSYSNVTTVSVATQGSSGGNDYLQSIVSIPPYVGGILPGWAQESQPIQGSAQYGLIRGVHLTTLTAITGTGSGGAGATLNILVYRAGAAATTAATLAFDNSVNTVALTPKVIPVSSTQNNIRVRFGDLVVFEWLQGATGLALPACICSVDLV